MYDVKKMGERIRTLRGRKSQDEVAGALKISRGALSFYENGERKPDADVIYRMCKYFGVTSDYLLGLSTVAQYNTDLQAVCSYTGLSKEAIDNLSTLKDRCVTEEFNQFIESKNFFYIVLSLNSIKNTMHFIREEYDKTPNYTDKTFSQITKYYTKIANGEEVDFYDDFVSEFKMDFVDINIINSLENEISNAINSFVAEFKHETDRL